MEYETIIGLEIHAQLLTESKMFCSCSTKFGAAPNANVCPICTGQPGVLPVANKKAIELALKTALALDCAAADQSIFARKNYFYPDLPKNYQISQYELPLAVKGELEIEVDGKIKKIGITRVHLEEDAGKLVHKGAERIMGAEESLVDLNRAGTPLMEIVSEPDLRSPAEAKIFMEELARLLEYLGVCDAKMEEGSLRCDANISLRLVGDNKFGTKTEIKNMNSFRAVRAALEAEEKRQAEMLDAGEKVAQETRFFDDISETTTQMRSKEFAHDYRYFPEPDLVPIEPSAEWLEEIKKSIGELPHHRKGRFINTYQLTTNDSQLLISNKYLADFLEECIKLYSKPKIVANWLLGELTAYLNAHKKQLKELNFSPAQLAEILELIDQGTISGKMAKEILVKVLDTGKPVKSIIAESGLTQISSEDELNTIIAEIIRNNQKSVEDYRKGKESAITFLMGQVMKATRGKANPALASKLLAQALKS